MILFADITTKALEKEKHRYDGNEKCSTITSWGRLSYSGKRGSESEEAEGVHGSGFESKCQDSARGEENGNIATGVQYGNECYRVLMSCRHSVFGLFVQGFELSQRLKFSFQMGKRCWTFSYLAQTIDLQLLTRTISEMGCPIAPAIQWFRIVREVEIICPAKICHESSGYLNLPLCSVWLFYILFEQHVTSLLDSSNSFREVKTF